MDDLHLRDILPLSEPVWELSFRAEDEKSFASSHSMPKCLEQCCIHRGVSTPGVLIIWAVPTNIH